MRASLAGGRRASRASHSNANRRVSHLRSRVSTSAPTSTPVNTDQEAAACVVPEDVEEEEEEEEADIDDGETSFRRESGMTVRKNVPLPSPISPLFLAPAYLPCLELPSI